MLRLQFSHTAAHGGAVFVCVLRLESFGASWRVFPPSSLAFLAERRPFFELKDLVPGFSGSARFSTPATLASFDQP